MPVKVVVHPPTEKIGTLGSPGFKPAYDGNILWGEIGHYNSHRITYTGCWEPEEFPFTPSVAQMNNFRSLGYWASAFPEGDGICFRPLVDKTHNDIAKDVTDCFDFELIESRDGLPHCPGCYPKKSE